MSMSTDTDSDTNEDTQDQPDSIKHRSPFGYAQHSVGDRGQRYEVRYADSETGKEKVMGWTDRADGGGLLRSALLWPAVKERPDGSRIAWVVDRHTGEVVLP